MSDGTLAQRVHNAYRVMTECDDELAIVVEAACGATSDDDDLRTDYYDNSLEVWGVGDIDLDAAARKLKESGFDRVWLHQHVGRANCRCPVR